MDNNIIIGESNINTIIIALEKFKKPHKDFIQDKECLICLESLDLDTKIESNKIVKLPCECANSVYHINCIIKLLHSGENKNFCPHCKTIYEISFAHVHVHHRQVVPLQYIVVQNIFRENLETQENIERLKNFTHIMLFHILLNSLMNIINIIATKNHPDHNINSEIQVAMLFYFCKIFFNYCILLYSKNNIEKIEIVLVCSYIFQIVLFGLIIYTLTKIKYDYNSIILIVNNILCNFIDLAFRIIVEYRMQNRVNVL
jgi:hypothetical protein